MLRLRITRRAASEIERADSWWRANRPAPVAIRDDLGSAFDLLLRQPGVGMCVSNTRLSGIRRLHLSRVRYFLYYRMKSDELVVLSFWHSSRGTGPSL